MKGGNKFSLTACAFYFVFAEHGWDGIQGALAYTTQTVFRGGSLSFGRNQQQVRLLRESGLWLSKDRDGDRYLQQWGAYQRMHPLPTFPSTFESVCDAACDAISSTLYDRVRPDPIVVSNAMSRSPLHYRPQIRHSGGRVGVEIDGASHLLYNNNDNGDDRFGQSVGVDKEAKALRRLALLMAGRLSQWPWKNMEDIENEDSYPINIVHQHDNHTQRTRPVTVYFTSLHFTLLATRELQHLKAQEKQPSYFDNVRICRLGQDDIPNEMLGKTAGGKKIRKSNVDTVDPQRGLLLVVQPSSTHTDIPFSPHDAIKNIQIVPPIEALQRLLSRATIYQIPSVMLSPRFTSIADSTRGHYRRQSFSTTTTANKYGGINGSGYQQSETYGGAEPPRPTPWLLRDYTPPAFAWVSTSNAFARSDYRPRVGLVHSVMFEGHEWHIFLRESRHNYQYLASTKTFSGRPSVGIMEKILNTAVSE